MPTSYQSLDATGSSCDRIQSQSADIKDQNATVADVLASKGGEVFSIGPNETLGRAWEVLRDRRIGALMIADEAGALVGILSERDIVRKLADTPGQTLPQLVGDVMTQRRQNLHARDAPRRGSQNR